MRRVLADMNARGVIRRIARRPGNGSRQSDMILLTAFEGRKPAPPGRLDDDVEPDNSGPSKQPAKCCSGMWRRCRAGDTRSVYCKLAIPKPLQCAI